MWETGRSAQGIHLRLEAAGGKRLTPQHVARVSRALLKIGFECAWLDEGDILTDSKYDLVREAVLGAPYDGFLGVVKQGVPDPRITSTADFRDIDGQLVMGAVLDVLGAAWVTCTTAAPAVELSGVDFISFTRRDMA